MTGRQILILFVALVIVAFGVLYTNRTRGLSRDAKSEVPRLPPTLEGCADRLERLLTRTNPDLTWVMWGYEASDDGTKIEPHSSFGGDQWRYYFEFGWPGENRDDLGRIPPEVKVFIYEFNQTGWDFEVIDLFELVANRVRGITRFKVDTEPRMVGGRMRPFGRVENIYTPKALYDAGHTMEY